MKRRSIIFCMFFVLMAASVVNGATYCTLETWTGSSFTGYRTKPLAIRYETVCINGYKFMNTAILEGEQGIALSTVQVFQNSKGISTPETCVCK